MFKNLSVIFLVGILICVAVYIGVWIGRANSSNIQDVPVHNSKTQAESDKSSFQKINLNTATVEELMDIPGIGKDAAQEIIQYRESYGKYYAVKELLYLKGIDRTLYEAISKYLTVSEE